VANRFIFVEEPTTPSTKIAYAMIPSDYPGSAAHRAVGAHVRLGGSLRFTGLRQLFRMASLELGEFAKFSPDSIRNTPLGEPQHLLDPRQIGHADGGGHAGVA
jgi:hypothetical protein